MSSNISPTNNTVDGPTEIGIKRAENLQVKIANEQAARDSTSERSYKSAVEEARRAGFRPQVRPSGG